MDESSGGACKSATYKTWIATSDTGAPSFLQEETKAAYAWELRNISGALVKAGNSALQEAPFGYHNRPLFYCISAALGFVPAASSVVVYSDVAYIRDLINLGVEGREKCDYRANKGKGKRFKDADIMRLIDRDLGAQSLYLTAERPALGSEEDRLLVRLKRIVSDIRQNINCAPSQWGI